MFPTTTDHLKISSTSKPTTKTIECYIEISGRKTYEYLEQDSNGWTVRSFCITSEALVTKLLADTPDIKFREIYEGE
jgi:hypothetical protein